jgi:hypothetical protein
VAAVSCQVPAVSRFSIGVSLALCVLTLPAECRGPQTYAEFRSALGRRTLDRLRADGRIRQIWGVLVPRELLLDPDTRAAAALLAAGPTAALTGLTAAWLQGCPAAATPVVHVAVPYSSSLRTQEGLVVHQGRRLLNEVIEERGLRTVEVEVAITELLCTDLAKRALAVADQAAALIPERERSAFRERIADRLATRADRRGTARAGALLCLITGRADSPPESWLKLLVLEAGFPPPWSSSRWLMRWSVSVMSWICVGRTCASRWSTTVMRPTSTGWTAMPSATLIWSGVDGSPSGRLQLTSVSPPRCSHDSMTRSRQGCGVLQDDPR